MVARTTRCSLAGVVGLAMAILPIEAARAELDGWPKDDGWAWSAAIGHALIYDYAEPSLSQVNHHVLRFDGILHYRSVMLELDAQYQGVGEASPELFLEGSVGLRAYQGPRVPGTWLTVHLLRPGLLPAGTTTPEVLPGVGIQLQMPLRLLSRGEARFGVRWYPLAGLISKTMHVGWDIGPIGLRVGGLGLRDSSGRFYSGFAFELCLRR
ncbi:MAG: hypothetical protein ACOX6T_19040 [Myxococcales bacterium]|jgi:hypothetical protein